jgi:serine/threonine-protein kinase RsbW
MHDAPVTLTFPAQPEYLRLARIATADAASRAGLDYEEIDDVRIAISELCTLLADQVGPTMSLGFTVGNGRLTIEGCIASDGGPVSQNELSRAIIAASVDEHELIVQPGEARFLVTKRHRGHD